MGVFSWSMEDEKDEAQRADESASAEEVVDGVIADRETTTSGATTTKTKTAQPKASTRTRTHIPHTPPLPKGRAFKAWIDVSLCEPSSRPKPEQRVQAFELSTKHLGLFSRNMIHVDAEMLILVHLIDAEPTILYGKVMDCEYDGNWRHRVIVRFEPIPDIPQIEQWVKEHRR